MLLSSWIQDPASRRRVPGMSVTADHGHRLLLRHRLLPGHAHRDPESAGLSLEGLRGR